MTLGEKTKQEDKQRFIELVGILNGFQDVSADNPDFVDTVWETLYLGYTLEILDIGYIGLLTQLPESMGNTLLGHYLNEWAEGLSGNYDLAIAYKNAQNEILDRRDLVLRFVSSLNHGIQAQSQSQDKP